MWRTVSRLTSVSVPQTSVQEPPTVVYRTLSGSFGERMRSFGLFLDYCRKAYFPDAEAVNMALRGLIALRPRRRRGRKAPS